MDRTIGGGPVFDSAGLDISHEAFMKMAEEMKAIALLSIGDTGLTPTLAIHSRTVSEEGQLEDITIDLCALMVPFNTQEEKETVLTRIGVKVYEERRLPVAVFLASEAWVSTQGIHEPCTRPPSEDPARQGCLVIFGETPRRDEQILIMYPVKREDEKLVRNGEPIISTDQCGKHTLLRYFWKGFFAEAIKRRKGIPYN